MRHGSLPARDADHPRRRRLKLGDLTGHTATAIRGEAVIAAIAAAITAIITVHFLTRYFKPRNLIPFGDLLLVFGRAMVDLQRDELASAEQSVLRRRGWVSA